MFFALILLIFLLALSYKVNYLVIFPVLYIFLCLIFSLSLCNTAYFSDKIILLMKNLTFHSCFDNATFFLEFYRQGLIFFILLIILWFLGFLFPLPASQKNTFQFSNFAYDRIFTNSKVNSFVINRFSFFTQLFITSASLFHFISVSGAQNWWRNSTYLLLQKPESFSLLPSLAVFFVKTSPALLIILATIITASDFRKTSKFLLFWYFVNFLYILSVNIAGNSRYSSLGIFVLGVGLLFKRYPTKIFGFYS